MDERSLQRREFLRRSATTLGAVGAVGIDRTTMLSEPAPGDSREAVSLPQTRYSGEYQGDRLNRVAFPMGGLGAGMICLEGTGALSHVSIRNRPDVFNEPCVFAAIAVKRGASTTPAAARARAPMCGITPRPFPICFRRWSGP